MRRWASALLWVVACSEPPLAPDAGDAGRTVVIAEPAPPDAPAPPAFTCPDGWRERDVGGGARACEPWADDRPPGCAAGELAIPGRGCEPIDTCPADGWPADLPAEGVIYVRAGAIGGDGTRALPLGDLRAGLAAAGRRDVIVALATGEYTGGSTVEMFNTELRGACASGTLVTNPETAAGSAALTVYPAEARIEHISLRGGGQVLWLAPGAGVTAREVSIEATGTTALRLDGNARFTGDRVRVEGVTTTETLGAPAVSLRLSTHLSLTRSTVIEGTTAIAYYSIEGDPAETGIEIALADTAVMGSSYGVGGVLEATLDRVAFEDNQVAIQLQRGSTATIRDLRVRGTTGGAQVSPLAAIDSTATVDRMWLSDGTTGGVRADLARGSIVMRDVVVFDYDANAVFDAVNGGSLEVDRLAVRRVAGVVAEAEAGTIVVRDCDVDGVTRTSHQNGDVLRSRGAAGRLRVERARGRNIARAFALAAAGGRIEAYDVDLERSMGMLAECVPEVGLECPPEQRSRVDAARVRMRAMSRFAFALENADGSLEDADIDGITGAGPEGAGTGVYVIGRATAERVRLRGATLWGVTSVLDGSSLAVSDLLVEDTAAATECDPSPCELPPDGDAVLCAAGGRLAMERFAIHGSARAGLTLADGCAELELSHGDIERNTFGVLSDESPDPWDDVRVEENDTDFHTLELSFTPITILD